jgi:hypothetical protein
VIFNVGVAVIVSALTQPDKKEYERRMSFHNWIRSHTRLPPEKEKLKPLAWIITLGWFFFGIGPGAVLGNDFFFWSAKDPSTWPFGMAPLWLWQIVWWLLGVYMMWFLAYKMEFSTHFGEVEALREDYQVVYSEKSPIRLDVEEPGV